MKKIIIVFVIVLLCCQSIACFAVTGINESDDISEQIVIKWMVYGEEYQDSDLVFKEFNKQLSKYMDNTVVEFEVVSKDNYKTRWDMKMATDEAFDLAWIGNEYFNYSEEVKKGSFMALDYLLSTDGKRLLENIPHELWELQVRDGNTYAIPIEGLQYRKSMSIVTKKLYADAFEGFNQIRDTNLNNKYTDKACYMAFEPYLEYAKSIESIGTGVSYKDFANIADKGLEGIYGSESPFVIKIFDDEIRVYNKYKLDIYKDYFETMAQWYNLGYIRQDVSDVINPSSEDGKQGGSILFLDEFADYIEGDERIQTEYEATYISVEGYKYTTYDSCRNSIVIAKNSENPQKAMQLIDLLFAEEGQDLYKLLVNGIEKEHYILLKDGTIVRRRDNDGKLLYSLSKNTIGNTFQNFEVKQGQFDRMRQDNQNAITSKLFGFNLDTRMIVINLEKIDLVSAKYVDVLNQGSLENWQEVYDEFVLKMDEAGSDQVVEEIQRQIDLFIKLKQ